MAAWRRLDRDRCTRCGRPREVHKDDKPEDYLNAFYTCTATVSQGRWFTWWRKVSTKLPTAAKTQAAEDKRLRAEGYDPDAAREWFTYTKAEGLPTT